MNSIEIREPPEISNHQQWWPRTDTPAKYLRPFRITIKEVTFLMFFLQEHDIYRNYRKLFSRYFHKNTRTKIFICISLSYQIFIKTFVLTHKETYSISQSSLFEIQNYVSLSYQIFIKFHYQVSCTNKLLQHYHVQNKSFMCYKANQISKNYLHLLQVKMSHKN